MSILLLSENTPAKIVSAAKAHGFDVVSVPSAAGMASPVSAHPDMIFFCGLDRLFVRSEHLENKRISDISDQISRLGYIISPTSDAPSELYPSDIAFNCFVIPQTALIGKADFISGAIKCAATNSGLPVIDTKQGYSKCSSVLISGADRNDSLVISADTSIIKSVADYAASTVKISYGHVSLPGYDTGFIGGASFSTDDTVYFLGDASRHPDFKLIASAASAFGRDVVSLSDEMLFDAGCLFIK